MLPFTRDAFLDVFADYNAALWPAAVAAYLAAAVSVVLVLRHPEHAGRPVGWLLALMWAWTGIAYHGLYFSGINPAAYVFAGLFVLQAVLFALAGGRGLRFGRVRGGRAVAAAALILYAGVLYPLVGLVAGHAAAELPLFGITPCPLTIFTFGILLLATPPAPLRLLAVPFLWAVVGGSAAILLGIPQDWVLPLAGLAAAADLFVGRRSRTARAEGHLS